MRYIAMSLLVALLFTAALYAEPNLPEPVALPEPVYLTTAPTTLVVPVPVPAFLPRPVPVEQAAAYLDLDAVRLHIGEYEYVEADLIAMAMPEPPGPAWLPPVFSPPATYPTNIEFWRAWVVDYSWPVEEALAIIGCESGGNSDAISRTNDWGLFQHHLTYWEARSAKAGYPNTSPLDPKVNVAVAWWLWNSKGGSWTDWTCGTILGLS